MNKKYASLARRIRNELSDLQIALEKCKRAWKIARKNPDEQDLFIDAVALNLHGLYSGLESLFELIGRQVDGVIPRGRN